jgi:hypothetical protein
MRVSGVKVIRSGQREGAKKRLGGVISAEPIFVIDLIVKALFVKTRRPSVLGNRWPYPRDDQADDEQDKEHEKQYLCDIACRACQSTKAKCRGDQSDHQEC